MKKEDEVVKEEKVNQPAGAPVVADSLAPISREVLSHQWQEGSPALNTNVLAGYGNTENVIEKMKAAEDAAKEKPKAAKVEKLSESDYKFRTSLDVSDPRYINSSLDHHESK